MLEPVQDFTERRRATPEESDSLLSRLFGVRRSEGLPLAPDRSDVLPVSAPGASAQGDGRSASRELGRRTESGPDTRREEIGERVSSGFRDLSRLLVAIKETLQDRDGQVRQTLLALPDYLTQVPRIQRAQIECMAQISRQLEHMGTGTRDVLARLESVPDLLRGLAVHQAEQSRFLDELQTRTAEALDVQSHAIREGLETNRRQAESQLTMVRSIAATQEDVFATFQNTQNRALNVFHRAQQQSNAQHRETQQVMGRQIEMLVEKVHAAQTRVFWLSIGFATLAAAGLIAALLLGGR